MEAPREEGKKRSPEEETEAEVHQAFRCSANALSQLYARSVATQKASFLAGERRAMEGVYQWISSQPEEASVSVADVFAYEENEIERRGAMAGSPQLSPQPANGSPSVEVQTNTFSLGNVAAALDSQQWQTDQTRTAGISNAHPKSFASEFLLASFGSVFIRIWSRQLPAKRRWSSEQQLSPKPGILARRFVRGLFGYGS